jgi:hypothetical protein
LLSSTLILSAALAQGGSSGGGSSGGSSTGGGSAGGSVGGGAPGGAAAAVSGHASSGAPQGLGTTGNRPSAARSGSVPPAPGTVTPAATAPGRLGGSGPAGSAINVTAPRESSAIGVSAYQASPGVPGRNAVRPPPSLIGSGATGVTGSALGPSLGNGGLGGIQAGVASATASGVASGVPALTTNVGAVGTSADLSSVASGASSSIGGRPDSSTTGSTGLPSPTNPSGSGPVSTLPSLVSGSLTAPIQPAATEGSGGLGSGVPTTRPTITPKEEAAEERSRAAVTAICKGC